MAKPMNINDHAFFGGKGSPKFPEGNKVKEYQSANGAGAEMNYEDTSEEIKAQQMKGAEKAKSHSMKPNYRN